MARQMRYFIKARRSESPPACSVSLPLNSRFSVDTVSVFERFLNNPIA